MCVQNTAKKIKVPRPAIQFAKLQIFENVVDTWIENLRAGTIAVRSKLPSTASHITDKQIWEALWHYYYDIETSVGYLVSTYVTKPKAQKKETRAAVQKSEGGLFSFMDAGVADCEVVLDKGKVCLLFGLEIFLNLG